jgi:AcrR family transcriptional regulator
MPRSPKAAKPRSQRAAAVRRRADDRRRVRRLRRLAAKGDRNGPEFGTLEHSVRTVPPDTRDNPDVKTSEPPIARPGPADRRRRRLTRSEAQALTRRRLLDSAADVFGEKGFRAASLADVADHAGYTIGAVYSNFASKDELFHALMRERLRMAEEGLAAAFRDDVSRAGTSTGSVEDRMERELDRMAAGEDAVPPRWWRLLYEYRAYAATDPAAWADLSDADRRCRDIIARHIERFAAALGQVLPMPAIEIAELSMALTDGLRAAHADGRSTMTSGEGLRMVVKALMATSARIDPA